jgi:hypothetical protein
MQKKFVALCFLASVSVMSVRAMDDEQIKMYNPNGGDSFCHVPRGSLMLLARSETRDGLVPANSLNSFTEGTKLDKRKEKNNEKQPGNVALLVPALSVREQRYGIIPTACGFGALSIATKKAIVFATPTVTKWYGSIAASGALNIGFAYSMGGLFGLYVIGKTVHDVYANMRDSKSDKQGVRQNCELNKFLERRNRAAADAAFRAAQGSKQSSANNNNNDDEPMVSTSTSTGGSEGVPKAPDYNKTHVSAPATIALFALNKLFEHTTLPVRFTGNLAIRAWNTLALPK